MGTTRGKEKRRGKKRKERKNLTLTGLLMEGLLESGETGDKPVRGKTADSIRRDLPGPSR